MNSTENKFVLLEYRRPTGKTLALTGFILSEIDGQRVSKHARLFEAIQHAKREGWSVVRTVGDAEGEVSDEYQELDDAAWAQVEALTAAK